MEPQIKYALTEDGASIGYWTVGEGRPFIWPPGARGSSSLRAWRTPEGRAFFERLAARRVIVRYDARGVANSQPGTVDFRLDARVRDLAAVVDRMGADNVDLCGYLDSGPAVLAYTAAQPQRVSHLVLWGTGPRGLEFVSPEVGELLTELGKLDPELAADAWTTATMRALGVGRDSIAIARTLIETVTILATGEFVRGLESDVTRVTQLLGEIQAPTLILHRRGMARPAMSEVQAVAARIPNARLAVLEGEVAWPYMGDAEPVLSAIDEFLGGDAGAAVHEARQAPGGLATVLFTDIVGHTEMMQRLGDAKGREVLREHERITRETLKQHSGAEVKTMGDGFMASFGSVTSAMECAIDLQRAFAAHTEKEGEPLHVRVGLNAGEPIEEDGDLFGATVILASRIAAKADGGEILIPEPVRHLLSGKAFTFSDRGEYAMKGFDDAVRLYEVKWRE